MATDTTSIDAARAKFGDEALLQQVKDKLGDGEQYQFLKSYIDKKTTETAPNGTANWLADRMKKTEPTTKPEPFTVTAASFDAEGAAEFESKIEESKTEEPKIEEKKIIAPPSYVKPSIYKGPSIVDYLNSIGEDSSIEAREKLAKKLGIEDYKRYDNAEENTQMLNILRGQSDKYKEREYFDSKITEEPTEELGSKLDPEPTDFEKNKLIETNAAKTLRDKFGNDTLILEEIAKQYPIGSIEYNKILKLLQDNPIEINTYSNIEGLDLGTDNTDLTSIDKNKISALDTLREQDLERIKEDFLKSVSVKQTSNAHLLALYGLNPDLSVDETNTNGFAAQYQAFQTQYEKDRKEIFEGEKDKQFLNAQGQMRALLRAKGIDVSKVPKEQLLALSGEIGRTTMTGIYNAKEKMINDVAVFAQSTMDKINKLREAGLISQNETAEAVETLRQALEATTATINKDYVNAVFGLGDAATAKAIADKKDLLNTVTSLGTALGLSGTKLSTLTSYIEAHEVPSDAYEAIIKALNDKTSALYLAVKSAEDAAGLIDAYERETDRLSATKTTGTTSVKLTDSQGLLKSILGLEGIMSDENFLSNYNFLRQEILIKSGTGESIDLGGGFFLGPNEIKSAFEIISKQPLEGPITPSNIIPK